MRKTKKGKIRQEENEVEKEDQNEKEEKNRE